MRRTAFIFCALLIAPALGAAPLTLRGGSFATIERPAAALPAYAEEWEAFLSLDGGRYYAVRITPHLDIARRQFVWLVPNVETTNARILIRTGDERRETLYELPATFAIVRDAHAELPQRAIVPSAHAEAAREGDPAVVAWTDGDRSGGALVQQWAAPAREGLVEDRRPRLSEERQECLSYTLIGAAPSIIEQQTPRRAPRVAAQSLPPTDVLLLTTRLNI
jgi:hypothetical protein